MTSDSGCDWEDAVAKALALGELDARLAAHSEGCDHCRAVIHVSQLLKKLAGEIDPQVPAAGFIWWQARVRHRQYSQQRFAKVIAAARMLTVALSTIALVAWVTFHWSETRDGLREAIRSVVLWSSSSAVSNASGFVYVCLLLLAVNIALTIRVYLSDRSEGGRRIDD